MKKKIILPILIFTLALAVSGCAKEENIKEEIKPVSVKAQSAESSRQIEENIEYAALVYPEEEALVVAKAGGSAREVKFKLGDKVKAGDVLLKIDDASGKNPAGNYSFNASQVKQAQLGVQQAYSALMMAQTSSQNSASVASENYRAAQIAYESAQLAAEQTRINLENVKKQTNLSGGDTDTNSILAANNAANTCDTIINGLNDYFGLDNLNFDRLPYSSSIGVLDSSVLQQTKDFYRSVKTTNDSYKSGVYADTAAQIKMAIDLATKTKKLADLSKIVVDKTITSDQLPQSSAIGISLNSLISAVGGYQSQASGALAQANGAKQSLENTDLGNDSSVSLLQKTYELAKKQEAAALQNINTLKASQGGQSDIARIQYENAVAVLQGLYDSHLAVAPISGVVTRKEIDNGTTISMGQTLAAVSQTDKVKVRFFVDADALKYLATGQVAKIVDNDGKVILGKISNLTTRADDVSKKFLIEVSPDSATSTKLSAGTVVNVELVLKKKSSTDSAVILPLSAIEVAQNNNFIFTIENGIAKRTSVKIIKVDGENAQIEFEGSAETLIIVEGNKLVRDGDAVNTK